MVFIRKEVGFGEQIVAVRAKRNQNRGDERTMIEAADRNSLTILTKFNPSFDWQGLKTTKPPEEQRGDSSGWADGQLLSRYERGSRKQQVNHALFQREGGLSENTRRAIRPPNHDPIFKERHNSCQDTSAGRAREKQTARLHWSEVHNLWYVVVFPPAYVVEKK